MLQAELLDLKANPDRLAVGAVLEATLDPDGTMHVVEHITYDFTGTSEIAFNPNMATITRAAKVLREELGLDIDTPDDLAQLPANWLEGDFS